MPALAHRPRWLAIGWCLVLLVVTLSLAPRPDMHGIEYNDKLGHLLAYFTLMAWFAQLYPRRLPVALAFAAMGGVLEILQGVMGYRDMAVADVLANAAGVGLGWLGVLPLPNLLAKAEQVLS